MIKLFSALYLGTSLDWVARRNLSHDTCTVVQVISNMQLAISFWQGYRNTAREKEEEREGGRERCKGGGVCLHLMYVYI